MLTFSLGHAWLLLQARIMRSRKEPYPVRNIIPRSYDPRLWSFPMLRAGTLIAVVREHGVLYVDLVPH